MPHDNIDRAVKKGAGAGADGETYMHLTYEGYGPAGVAVYLTVLTDNKNRTAADVRYAFDRSGGKLGTDGSVSWMFERKGVIFVDAAGKDEDEVMMAAIEAGAEDVLPEGDAFEIRTDPAEFMAVRAGLEAAGIKYSSAEITMIPKNTVALDESEAKKTFRLIDALEDNDDVQDVYANFDISDEVMEALEG
jgi:YebC/PmpR family DNA-binding regulatory protein